MPPGGSNRAAVAVSTVQRGLLRAEEKYLVDSGASLGTWFARVQETIAVACRVSLERIEESRRPTEAEVANELMGVFADICAEAIRAAAQVWRGGSSPRARDEILRLVSVSGIPASDGPSWNSLLESLARCNAALEPLANGLREQDLPMGEPTDCDRVSECLFDAAERAFGALYGLS